MSSSLIRADDPNYTKYVRSHLNRVIQHSVDDYGPDHTRMWLATIDTSTGRLPKQPLPARLRWYRKITSPNGSNLYWDQPTILVAYAMSKHTNDDRYAASADAYIRDFLNRCVAPQSGLFMWGNHIYYDVVRDQVAPFSGGHHECRPHTPAWECLWKHDAKATERAIRSLGLAHIKDQATGRFCRHANWRVVPGEFTEAEVKKAMPFLEAGASLIDSLCWLAKQTGDADGKLMQMALQAARYSFAQRDQNTGLLRNQPIEKRWDYFASTTEVGLWAGSLIRATDYTGNDEFLQIAEAAVRPWLRFGFDSEAGKYYGRLAVDSGTPQPPEKPRGWIPPIYAEVFDIHERPTHNYPMPMAETCLSLSEKTSGYIFVEAVERWVTHIRTSLPANGERGAYAEDYGRVIHFLVRASRSLNRPEYLELARKIADEAIERLFVVQSGMFRSHPGENRCDAVDGLGILLLALLYLDTGEEPASAFAF
jgi:hypothetical protein